LYSKAQATLLVFAESTLFSTAVPAESSENLIAADAPARYSRFGVGGLIPRKPRRLVGPVVALAWLIKPEHPVSPAVGAGLYLSPPQRIARRIGSL
jgi:hypothetical protein